jgi:hypothetical protein
MPHQNAAVQDDRQVALEKVLKSSTFSRSDSSRQLLKFIVEKSLSGSQDNLKEYTIATEALRRPSDFDPKADSIVRIQVQRLRKRLEEYYSEEGASDPVKIVIPSGHYLPEFRDVTGHHPRGNRLDPQEVALASPAGIIPSRNAHPWMVALGVILLGVTVVMGLLLFRASGLKASSENSPLPGSLVPLWGAFLPPNPSPLVIYSNAIFLEDDSGDVYEVSAASGKSLPSGTRMSSLSGLDYIPPLLPHSGKLHYFDLYTGTGEVVAAAKIAQLLAAEKQDISLERSGLVSYDYVRNRNVIFLGASFEDPVLAKLPVEAELVFEMSATEGVIIRDRRATSGQHAFYRLARNDKTGEYQTDYALISLLPSVEPGRSILVLGGLTTLGIQAAAEFATSPAQMATLEKLRPDSRSAESPLPYFQSLLEVQIRGDAIARITPLLVHELRHK